MADKMPYGDDLGGGGRSEPAEDITLIRGHATDLTVDGRTIVGLAVPFGRAATVSDGGPKYKEEFRHGAFAATIATRGMEGVLAHALHQTTRLPIGRSAFLEETPDGLVSHLRVSKTTQGSDTLELVKDGALTGLSIGFRPIKHQMRGDVKVRTEVALHEISVVANPAYPDARISGVRALEGLDLDELITARVREALASLRDPAIPADLPMEVGADDPHDVQSVRLTPWRRYLAERQIEIWKREHRA